MADHDWQVDFSVNSDIETFARATIANFWGTEYGTVHIFGKQELACAGHFTGVFDLFLHTKYLHTLTRTVCTSLKYVDALCEWEIVKMKRNFPPINDNSAVSTQGNTDKDKAAKAGDESLMDDDRKMPAIEEDQDTKE